MVLSCRCLRQIQAPSARLAVICIAHNIPLYSQYHLSLFRFICLPGVATPSVMHFFFFSPHHTAASDTVYIIPSHSHSHSLERKEKRKYISLTHALFSCFLFLTGSRSFFLSSRTLCLTVSPHACILPSCLFTPRDLLI